LALRMLCYGICGDATNKYYEPMKIQLWWP
jgi:hypothetical protein